MTKSLYNELPIASFHYILRAFCRIHFHFMRYQIYSPPKLHSWDPADYGGIESIRVPVERVWVPDIVLFNKFCLNSLFPTRKLLLLFFFFAVLMVIMKSAIRAMLSLIIKEM